MIYGLYVDLLFLINFVVNLLLLLLVNENLGRTATRWRMVLGAGVGAICFFIPFLLNGSVKIEMALGMMIGSIFMILISFPVYSVKMFWRILEIFFSYSILVGGIVLLFLRFMSFFHSNSIDVWWILGVGVLCFIYFRKRKGREYETCICKVTIMQGGKCFVVNALLDSGNSLIEPISGVPVSIIDKECWNLIKGEQKQLARIIPYHSIGKEHGFLEGYRVEELRIEVESMIRIYKNSYVAICEGKIMCEQDCKNPVQMILNPMLLEGEGK